MINLSRMISILNFVFTIYFEKKLNQKSFESNFQFLAAQKYFHIFIFFFLFHFDSQVFLLLSFWPISYSQPYFLTDPISSSSQQCIQPTDPIFFGHLRPPDASYRLRPPRPPHHSSLCHPTLTLWSRITSSLSSPLKTAAPHRLPFSVSISRNRRH
jgi:hypothetical protein